MKGRTIKQVTLSYSTGEIELRDVPAPLASPGTLLVQNVCSVVSAGTERQLADFAKRSLIGKARARPDQVRRVLNKVRTDGPLEAYRQASARLTEVVPLGYSAAGIVLDAGPGAYGFSPGDRVACAGHGHASHAEVIRMPVNLCIRIPEEVDFEQASFGMLGAIALHGVRSLNASIGERVVVIGLGLLGLIAIQILKAAGCHVLGLDEVEDKLSLAKGLGADEVALASSNVTDKVADLTSGRGADAVLVTASSESNEPIELAGEISRLRGRIVVIGSVRLDVPRNLFFEKELELTVSKAAGPGIDDPVYEQKGIDYPASYVRWTEGRNIEAFLELVAAGKVTVAPLITHRIPIERALDAYSLLLGERKEPYVGITLQYPDSAPSLRTVHVEEITKPRPAVSSARTATGRVGIGVIGTGLFAKGTMLPLLKKRNDVRLKGIVATTGVNAQDAATRFGFAYSSTDHRELLEDPEIECLFVLTRHDSHAELAAAALEAGKHVFVEKPLALDVAQLSRIVEAHKATSSDPRVFMVGFNRRFSPMTAAVREWFAERAEPLAIVCRVNAGEVESTSWVHDAKQGGGRILGEVCHFIDLVQSIAASDPVEVTAQGIAAPSGVPTDNLVATIKFADGSLASIVYVATGNKRFPRERVEVFGASRVAAIDNFTSLTLTAADRKERKRSGMRPDLGHPEELDAFIEAVRRGGPSPVAFEDYVATTVATFSVDQALGSSGSVAVDPGAALSGAVPVVADEPITEQH